MQDEVGDSSAETRESSSLHKEVMRGRHIFDDGTIYEGELVLGKPNGYGTRELVNGDLFEGQHKDGFAHGRGTIRYKSDSRLDSYIGSWNSGKGWLWYANSQGFFEICW